MFKHIKTFSKVRGVCLYFAFLIFSNSSVAEDVRDYSIKCKHNISDSNISCDYRYALNYDVKNVSAKVDGKAVQINGKDLKAYPSKDQTSAVIILADTSDPRRKDTIERKYKQVINIILDQQKNNQNISLATFDSNMDVIVPFTNDKNLLKDGLLNIKANGLSTEFYKSILAGIELLNKTESTRKGLIILSDGKDEDRAYKKEDVFAAAKDANVSILGIGFQERNTDSPYLQTLQKLAIETYGQYINGTDLIIPNSFKKQPIAFIESGGTVLIDANNYYGKRKIEVILGLKNGKEINLSTEVNLPDTRSNITVLVDFLSNNLLLSLGSFVLILFVVVGIIFYISKKNKIVTYAYLKETDSKKTEHKITKDQIRLGRNDQNDIVLKNDSVSLFHSEITRRRDGQFFISDLSSTNGTYINDKKLTQSILTDGDLIEIGEVRLYFYENITKEK